MVEDSDGDADPEGVEWLDSAADDADSAADDPADGDDSARETDASDERGRSDDSAGSDRPASGQSTDDADEYGVTLDSKVESDHNEESAAATDVDAIEYETLGEFEKLDDDVDDEIDSGLLGDAPDSDQEMPLTEHIEEMMRRLGVVFLVGIVVTLALFPGADIVSAVFGIEFVSATEVISYLWNSHIPGAPEIPDRRPRLYGPLELILTELKVAALAGFVVGLPVLVYETFLFMRPGLYPRERRYYVAAIPTSLVLAAVGILFSHFVVLPVIFQYFTAYTTGTAVVAFGLRETFNLILIMMGYNALIFQIPLFIMLAIMMGLTTRVWLEDKRLLFWGGFAGVAFLINPDPTGMAPIIIIATMITLFEGTLLLLRWTGN